MDLNHRPPGPVPRPAPFAPLPSASTLLITSLRYVSPLGMTFYGQSSGCCTGRSLTGLACMFLSTCARGAQAKWRSASSSLVIYCLLYLLVALNRKGVV